MPPSCQQTSHAHSKRSGGCGGGTGSCGTTGGDGAAPAPPGRSERVDWVGRIALADGCAVQSVGAVRH